MNSTATKPAGIERLFCYDVEVATGKPASAKQALLGRRYFVRGRVQGVGFRWFAERTATELGVRGYARNLSDGRVEVYAVGTAEQLSRLNGELWIGPRQAEVRGVEEQEAPVENYRTFFIAT